VIDKMEALVAKRGKRILLLNFVLSSSAFFFFFDW
jgi:hypothetical protein